MVPGAILDNPRKQGINAPVTRLIDFAAPDMRDRLLSDSPFFDLVNRQRFEGLLGSEVARNSDSKFLFSLLAARAFIDRHASWRE